jgi:hypothetical protein
MPAPSAPPPAARAIVLGASNVELYRRALVRALLQALPGPLEIHLVCGLGRSYGLPSFVLGRELCSIGEAGLWRALERAPAAPTFALVADVGNDLAYGAAPERVAGWIEDVLARLAAREARAATVGLPLGALRALGPLRFALFRAMYFPGRGLARAPLVAAAERLERSLAERSRARGLGHVVPPAGWFGLDPIHLRPRAVEPAFDAWLAALGLARGTRTRPPGARSAAGRARPARSRLFGRERAVPQPSAHLPGGGSLSWW